MLRDVASIFAERTFVVSQAFTGITSYQATLLLGKPKAVGVKVRVK